jgi:hypothetical protein
LFHRDLISHRVLRFFFPRGTSNHEYFIPRLIFGFNYVNFCA